MPSSSTRSRAGARQPATPPRAARRRPGRNVPAPPAVPRRPLQAPFAAAFGLLVATEDLFLTWLLAHSDPGWHWYLPAPVLLAAWAAGGAVLVVRGRGRGALVLAGAAVLPLLGILALAVVLGLWAAAARCGRPCCCSPARSDVSR
jgi:hypothetical protein